MADENLDSLLAEFESDDGEVTGEGDLAVIAALANKQLRLEVQVQQAEDTVRMLKEELRDISQDKLPEAMAAVGMSEFTLDSGAKVTVKEDLATSIKSGMQEAAFQWLEENGHGAIVKHVLSLEFGKGENDSAEAAKAALQAAGYDPQDKESVNHQTLQKWGRDMEQEGMRPPEELFHSFDVRITKIKTPK